jgi:hypothetical protein
MRRRLYFLLPDVDSAKRTADDLLLARIEDRHMRFLAKRGTDLGELHEASYLQKTDLVHGAGIGLMLGGIGGLILGAIIVAYPPNSRLKQFQEDIERGKVLAMVDVPYGRVGQIRDLVRTRHPEAVPGGQETRFPAFP